VLNRDADIVYISGRTGKYLEPAAGKANWNIHAMARDGLRQPLAQAIKQAADSDTPIKLHDVEVRGENGAHRVDVTVQAISEPASLRGLTMVVFSDVAQREPTAAPGKRKAAQAGKADAQPTWPRSRTCARRLAATVRKPRLPRRNCNRPMKNCSQPTRN
jgi:two-component system, chemotaxis family, CheB/CheR fusion protein